MRRDLIRFFTTVFFIGILLAGGMWAIAVENDTAPAIESENTPAGVFTSTDAFEKANQAYKDGEFATALECYQQALQVHGPLSEIYYNMGNAYFKQNKKGLALVHFLRAEERAPRNAEIDKNIAYLKSLIEYKIDDRTSWYAAQLRKLLSLFTRTELSVGAWAGVLVLLIIMFLWLFVEGKARAIVGVIVAIQVILTASMGLMVLGKTYFAHPGSHAVVIKKETAVRYGPSKDDKVMFNLVEGLELYVIDRRAEWSRIVLLNKETGWVSNKAIELV
jgi:tetratricopeptide (TPR) repeat protein